MTVFVGRYDGILMDCKMFEGWCEAGGGTTARPLGHPGADQAHFLPFSFDRQGFANTGQRH